MFILKYIYFNSLFFNVIGFTSGVGVSFSLRASLQKNHRKSVEPEGGSRQNKTSVGFNYFE